MGAQIVIWTFYDQVVEVEKGWVEQEFVLLIAKWSRVAKWVNILQDNAFIVHPTDAYLIKEHLKPNPLLWVATLLLFKTMLEIFSRNKHSWGHILSRVRPFYEWAVSNQERFMQRSLFV